MFESCLIDYPPQEICFGNPWKPPRRGRWSQRWMSRFGGQDLCLQSLGSPGLPLPVFLLSLLQKPELEGNWELSSTSHTHTRTYTHARACVCINAKPEAHTGRVLWQDQSGPTGSCPRSLPLSSMLHPPSRTHCLGPSLAFLHTWLYFYLSPLFWSRHFFPQLRDNKGPLQMEPSVTHSVCLTVLESPHSKWANTLPGLLKHLTSRDKIKPEGWGECQSY